LVPKISSAREQRQREAILRAAVACYRQKGFHRATIQDICDNAQLSKGGLYTYFQSKEEILAAVIEESMSTAFQQAVEVAREGGSVIDRLDRVAEAVLMRRTADEPNRHLPQLSLEIWAEASNNPQLRVLCSQSYEQWRRFLGDLLREGIANGELKAWMDPDVFAAILVAVFDGLSLQEGMTDGRADWRRITQNLRRGLAEGIVV